MKEALAYGLYMASNTFLPNVVNAVVLFYGGTLVLVGQMSAGALVAFMLYQQSLASAFQVTAHYWYCLGMPIHALNDKYHSKLVCEASRNAISFVWMPGCDAPACLSSSQPANLC